MRTWAQRAATKAVVWGVVGLAAGVAGHVHAQTPSLRFIQPSPGYEHAGIADISDNGIIVARSYNYSPSTWFTWGSAFKEDPSNLGAERVEFASGVYAARISGYGNVVAVSSTNLDHDLLYYQDGSSISLPNLQYLDEEQQGRVTHISHDGSVVMLNASPFVDGHTQSLSYRWTSGTGTAQIPSVLQGSTYNTVRSISSDGRLVAGQAGPSVFGPHAAFLWDSTQSEFTPMTFPDGSPLGLDAEAPIMSGDGRTLFVRYIDTVMIHDGVSTYWNPQGPYGVPGLLPADLSNDASVAIGGGGAAGHWIWTEETGAISTRDYFSMHGIEFPAGGQIGVGGVSGDGLHFYGAYVFGDGTFEAYVATIPAPGIAIPILTLLALSMTRRRARE